MTLGETVRLDGEWWMAVGFDATGRALLAKIPAGETAMGLGRTWRARDQPQRWFNAEPKEAQ